MVTARCLVAASANENPRRVYAGSATALDGPCRLYRPESFRNARNRPGRDAVSSLAVAHADGAGQRQHAGGQALEDSQRLRHHHVARGDRLYGQYRDVASRTGTRSGDQTTKVGR